jgi:acyl carrier protein
MEELIERLKGELILELNLEEIAPQDIDADAPLFGEGLGLDSIDALEIILLLERSYGVKVKNPNDDKTKAVFRSVRTLAEHIMSETTNP